MDDNGRNNFKTFGDVDYAFEDINQKRDEIIGDLQHFYNQELDHETLNESLQYLQRLLEGVQKLKDQHTKSITGMRKKDKQNTATLPRLVLRQKKCIQSIAK